MKSCALFQAAAGSALVGFNAGRRVLPAAPGCISPAQGRCRSEARVLGGLHRRDRTERSRCLARSLAAFQPRPKVKGELPRAHTPVNGLGELARSLNSPASSQPGLQRCENTGCARPTTEDAAATSAGQRVPHTPRSRIRSARREEPSEISPSPVSSSAASFSSSPRAPASNPVLGPRGDFMSDDALADEG